MTAYPSTNALSWGGESISLAIDSANTSPAASSVGTRSVLHVPVCSRINSSAASMEINSCMVCYGRRYWMPALHHSGQRSATKRLSSSGPTSLRKLSG